MEDPMVTIARRHEPQRWDNQRARQLVDTALSSRRIAIGISSAGPAPLAFFCAALYSLLLWLFVLAAAWLI